MEEGEGTKEQEEEEEEEGEKERIWSKGPNVPLLGETFYLSVFISGSGPLDLPFLLYSLIVSLK